ncbi:hypothetical protein CR513_42176, partial [Mucuna pruriens]
MYHWRIFLCQCHVGPRSFNQCHANVNLQSLEFWDDNTVSNELISMCWIWRTKHSDKDQP